LPAKDEDTMAPANVLLIHSDQHRFDCLGINGHPFLETPHLDMPAREGVRFTHAFTPNPLCVPERNCLLNGQWSSENLCIADHDTEAPRPSAADLPTFSCRLNEAGCYLGCVGKWHVDVKRGPTEFGFHEHVGLGQYGRWRAAEYLYDFRHRHIAVTDLETSVGAHRAA